MQEEVDQLFNTYATRKRTEAGERLSMEEAKEAMASKTRAILVAIVLPVLKDISESIQRNGGRSKIKESVEGSMPRVEIAFSPTRQPNDSALSFEHTESGAMAVKQQMKPLGKPDYKSNENWPLATLSEELVRSHTVAFVAAVLSEN